MFDIVDQNFRRPPSGSAEISPVVRRRDAEPSLTSFTWVCTDLSPAARWTLIPAGHGVDRSVSFVPRDSRAAYAKYDRVESRILTLDHTSP